MNGDGLFSYNESICFRFGRKKPALVAIFLLGCCGTVAAFSTDYYMFVVLRFLIACFGPGMYMAMFVIGMCQ